jgi:flagellar L-ring protein precursor FlgH
MMKLNRSLRYVFVSAMSAILLGACASADRPSLLSTPTTARPRPIQETSANMGSLYPANSGGPYINAVSHRPLFEDRRARNVGDTLTVVLNETTSEKFWDGGSTKSKRYINFWK